MSLPRKANIDVSQCFLVYMSLVGDAEKTAAALDLDPKFVRDLAKDEGWDQKIQRVCLLSKGERPGDYERAVNRALCFVQAHQTSQLLDRLLTELRGLDGADLLDAVSVKTKFGSTYSARLFADITAAMEKCHQMKYAALGDTVKERDTRANSEGGDLNANDMHAAVISALNGVARSPESATQIIIDAQGATVKQLAEPAPESDENKFDTHAPACDSEP